MKRIDPLRVVGTAMERGRAFGVDPRGRKLSAEERRAYDEHHRATHEYDTRKAHERARVGAIYLAITGEPLRASHDSSGAGAYVLRMIENVAGEWPSLSDASRAELAESIRAEVRALRPAPSNVIPIHPRSERRAPPPPHRLPAALPAAYFDLMAAGEFEEANAMLAALAQ